uniref:ACP phosphodiesterase n=1 Tax=Roseihalotalea indica TaxID=2867963 RepID=A0AA49GTN5_9BACT|nr:ACP phosphodiesterase [Tunicatimonas sp. TK19036]
MNFLAHFYLSGHTPSMIIGSFLGDFVKGSQYQQFDTSVAEAILLHREIDQYTDHHPAFLESKHRLQEKHNHYSGVIVDIFYDHFLANAWSDYSDEPLETFAQTVYQTLHKQHAILPPDARQVLHYMSQHNWLVNYEQLEGIRRTLMGMEKRSQYPNQMGAAITDLTNHFEEFEQEFSLFFPDLQQHVENWLVTSDK